ALRGAATRGRTARSRCAPRPVPVCGAAGSGRADGCLGLSGPGGDRRVRAGAADGGRHGARPGSRSGEGGGRRGGEGGGGGRPRRRDGTAGALPASSTATP